MSSWVDGAAWVVGEPVVVDDAAWNSWVDGAAWVVGEPVVVDEEISSLLSKFGIVHQVDTIVGTE
ncbi:hypothetical protein ACTFIW_010698 [Dictyostelium discoideum]